MLGMGSKSSKTLPDDIVAQIILGEAAGEGPNGLEFVADTMLNRAFAQGKTLEEVATAPAQFSASARPDLQQFYLKQPQMLRDLAQALVTERRDPAFTPKYHTSHYVTQDFYNNRHTLPKSHWVHRMDPVGTVGNHVALRQRRQK